MSFTLQYIYCYLSELPLHLFYRTFRFSFPVPLVPLSICFLFFRRICVFDHLMSHKYSFTINRNATPPAPLFLLSCPLILFPHSYVLSNFAPDSPPLFPHDSSIPTISRSRLLTCSTISINSLLHSSVANPHIHTSIFLFSAYFLFHYPLYFGLLFLSAVIAPILYYLGFLSVSVSVFSSCVFALRH